MAKIISVNLTSIPECINVSDNISDITVETKIEFHPLDISLGMEYCLHVYIYDIHGDLDTPFVLPNWDESDVNPISLGRKDDYLGGKKTIITATPEIMIFKTPIALHLGHVNRDTNYISRKLKAFTTITPAISSASKWSEPFTSQIIH
ncbi:hypothetical protein Celal_2803 [Cellulophaga algicola DSM 14237]|uniref:Uncharacterized protein n=1 Tax=Cellulophaga algicola (strain DSM 14237 / IC166 / ACAM 630) TaxID=688270 RepID=E6XCU3_CELAD|nr:MULTISPECIES: hypothetical protein [Cellulophaga]ADV50084.1 hypothetical protein Celal_2803 [Cellulophaga algicola DSM 14237]